MPDFLKAAHSVHWGINPPPQKHHPPLSCQASPLNLQTVQAPPPPFRQPLIYILVFRNSPTPLPPRPPLKIGFFNKLQIY